jgi:preprotein translocase subunit YajC
MGAVILPIILLALMWLLLIRPQQQRLRAQQALIASIEVGDEVISTGGIYGRIRALADDTVLLEVADGVEVRLARAAIGQRVGPERPTADELDEAEGTADDAPPPDEEP